MFVWHLRQRDNGIKKPQEFDDNKFVSFEASERYITLMQIRKPIPKRGFTATERKNPILYRMISSKKWDKFTSQPPMFVTNIVREFYANADEHRRGKVIVRGKTVSFESSSINKFYGLPDIPNSDYISYLSNVNYEDVCNTLYVLGSSWKVSGGTPKTLAGTSLTVEARAW